MSQTETKTQHHHHHHHHHRYDDATLFKRRSLMAIERRKKLAKWGFIALCAVAVIMFIAVIVLYRIK